MPDPKEIGAAIKQICEEKGIPFEAVISTIETALAVAYRKETGKKGKDIRVEFNANDGSMRIFEVTTVVEDELYADYLKDKEAKEKAEAEAAATKDTTLSTPPSEALPDMPMVDEAGEPIKRFNPKTDIAFADARKEIEDIEVGDEIRDELEVPSEFGRMAAQTAKQVIIQKLREAERETLFKLYQDRSGEVINAMIQRVEGKIVFVDLGQAIAVMPPSEQVRNETYKAGQRLKVLLLSIEKTNRGPEILASRSNPKLVSALFSAEVPEIAGGTVVVKGVAREAGSRTKIAVAATDPNIDPIGSCVGQRGTRVQTVINELSGEKIDIIHHDDDPVKFIVHALSPAKIASVTLKEEEGKKIAVAEVPEDQFSLAIGRSGQNVRLASRLTGWSIDIVKLESAPAEGTAGETEATPPSDTAAEDVTPAAEATVESTNGAAATTDVASGTAAIASESKPE
jgi:N utilization substance protein A